MLLIDRALLETTAAGCGTAIKAEAAGAANKVANTDNESFIVKT
jgi:hypothetical protein